jgi:hypothetical protein
LLKYWLLALCAAVIPLFPLHSASGEDANDDFSDSYMALRYDYFFSVKANELKQFMNYRGSKLYPITRLAVAYTYNPRNEPKMATKDQPYENLWYLEGAPVGCRRIAPLKIAPGSKGAIMLMPGSNLAAQAEVDAIVRLMLDSALLRSLCDVVVVPKDAFETIYSAFSSFGFYEVNVPLESPYPGFISITLLSNPPGRHTELVFDDRRSL